MSAFEPHELLKAAAAQGNLVEIDGVQLVPIEYNGARVLTLSMMDAVHQRPKDTARKRFNDNKARFIEGEDYFVRNSDEAKQMGYTAPNGLTLLTETGYSMLVKSFTDDLAWDVQRQLVKSYFAKPVLAPVAQPRRAGGNKSLDSFRQARALDIVTGVADRICAKFPSLGAPAQQGIYATLVNGVVGQVVIPLPKIERMYNATEVGAKFGVNKAVVGRLAKAHGVKIDKYGEWLLDKSQSSEKQVENFHYNEAGVARIGELLGHGGKPASGGQAQLGFDPPAG